MPLKECAYSLPHMGKIDPNSPNAPFAKALTEIGSVLKVGLSSVVLPALL